MCGRTRPDAFVEEVAGAAQDGRLVRCEQFIDSYSEYLDGVLGPEDLRRLELHRTSCPRCRRYDRVLRGGLRLCRSLPPLTSSPDFRPRLNHRLYHIDDGARLGEHRHLGSAALVAIASVGLLALAWLPFATRMAVEVELPPAVVATPAHAGGGGPDLFGPGPFVAPAATFMDTDLRSTLDGSDDFFSPDLFDDPAVGVDAGPIESSAEGLR